VILDKKKGDVKKIETFELRPKFYLAFYYSTSRRKNCFENKIKSDKKNNKTNEKKEANFQTDMRSGCPIYLGP
jgi:hypothetical protein